MDGAEGAPARRLGRYVLRDRIAAGGMATVYFGRLEGPSGFRRTVAIKHLHPHLAADPDFVAMFLDEARLAARIHHPNVVQTLDVVTDEGEVFVVMEYVHGESLARVSRAASRDKVRPSVRIAASVVCNVLHGLHAAHIAKSDGGLALGIVHRDVSPQNVIVGTDGIARVLDFGVAKARGRESLTRDGKVKGKLAYMAPEQLEGGAIDRRADVYAAGILLWELLTGEPLFDREHEGATLKEVLERGVVAPSERTSGIPERLDAITLRALSNVPARRFDDARQMALALEREGLASPSEVAEWLEATVGDVLSRRAETLAAIESSPDQARTAPPPALAADRPRRSGAVLAAAVGGVVLTLVGLGLRTRAHSSAAPAASAALGTLASLASVFALPLPEGTNDKARAAYREAMQAFHDGSILTVRRRLVAATELDPGLGAAHVRCMWFLDEDIETARVHGQAARRLRRTLGERDLALLDALDPGLQDPSDVGEVERRLASLVDRYPSDIELLYYLAATLEASGQHRAALERIARVLDIDPTFATALLCKAKAEEGLLDLEGARASLERCLDVSPSAASCLRRAAFAELQAGDSARLLVTAKRMIEIEERSWPGYGYLARALRARDAPREAVAEALRKKWSLFSDRERSRAQPMEEIDFDTSDGDFQQAEARALALEREMPATADGWDHAELTRRLIGIYGEMGQTDGALAAAERYYKKRSALSGPAGGTEIGFAALDAFPSILATLHRGNQISKESYTQERDAWLGRWTATLSAEARRYLWVPGFAVPAETRAEALDALAALPAYLPLPAPLNPDAPMLAPIARVYFLAGSFEEAAPRLERAVAACTDLDFPIDHTRAAFYLGETRQRLGDVRAACAAYARVLERWGAARPRSITANQARERRAALGCR